MRPATWCRRRGQIVSRSHCRACSHHRATTACASANTRSGSASARTARRATEGHRRCAADAAATLLASRGRDKEQVLEVFQAGLEEIGFAAHTATGLTKYLLYVGKPAQNLLADYCDEWWDDLAKTVAEAKKRKEKQDKAPRKTTAKTPAKKPTKQAQEQAKRILHGTRAADIAMFGRMIADNTDFNVNAASQVAHALSTHAVVNEFDYYTALDDLRPDAEPAADMIGTVDFNAACFYRYANLDLEQLATNLPGDPDLVARSARAWLYAFIHAVPGGKQNSMAARTMPQTLLGVVRETGAWNLANAFLSPVTDVPDLMAASTQRLVDHFQQLRSFYGETQLRHTTIASVDSDPAGMPENEIAPTLDDFVSRLLTATKG
ncbi:type I-E CRISPR-associated protein Cas7/Cse4/CasC [Streptomyces sp. NPDC006355]|uniref:type I-E CRISPR-associated protein Cas7/Cse4/CasC n=1 Tax=Streptomyces sp. NPDC006355 TaxID=3156758 RepID=UPI0033A87FDF